MLVMSVFRDDDMDRFDEVYGDLDLSVMHQDRRHLVFVYGTLMSHARNHKRLQKPGIRRISRNAQTESHRFAMFCRDTMAGYAAPIVVRARKNLPNNPLFFPIAGEVYEIDNETLLELDAFEGHPDYYRRQRVAIAEQSKPVWMYLFERPLEEVTMDGILVGARGYRWDG